MAVGGFGPPRVASSICFRQHPCLVAPWASSIPERLSRRDRSAGHDGLSPGVGVLVSGLPCPPRRGSSPTAVGGAGHPRSSFVASSMSRLGDPPFCPSTLETRVPILGARVSGWWPAAASPAPSPSFAPSSPELSRVVVISAFVSPTVTHVAHFFTFFHTTPVFARLRELV